MPEVTAFFSFLVRNAGYCPGKKTVGTCLAILSTKLPVTIDGVAKVGC